MLLGFVLLGCSLEERAWLKASSDMNELLSHISTESRLVITSSGSDSSTDVVGSDAICIEVPTDDIRVGDSLLIFLGETIFVDRRVFQSQLVQLTGYAGFKILVGFRYINPLRPISSVWTWCQYITCIDMLFAAF
uniref:Uncharacterized protein n=1 Tax=Solanum lycopersicum TaxID=4081 RepID=A0A3Q7HM08_SOLLC